jgi:hypothetical protein
VQWRYTGEGVLVKTKKQPTLKAPQEAEATTAKAKANRIHAARPEVSDIAYHASPSMRRS